MTAGEPLIRWEWFASNADELLRRLGEHLLLTGVAVGLGTVIAFALTLAVLRWPRAYGFAASFAATLYTIPSLALFALLIPFTGLTLLTAEIGLVGYTLLILLRAFVGGIRSVPAEAVEAARGIGYTGAAMLWRVQLPLALPVIVGGIRVATVTTIGLVTVTALIGQGGMGHFILLGIQRLFATPLLAGALLSVALAIVADAVLVMAQRALTPWARARG